VVKLELELAVTEVVLTLVLVQELVVEEELLLEEEDT
jgi:hypothetical protein